MKFPSGSIVPTSVIVLWTKLVNVSVVLADAASSVDGSLLSDLQDSDTKDFEVI
jgi:hypothetical protein